MKKSILSSLLFCLFFQLSAQDRNVPESMNISLQAKVDDNTITTIWGLSFNDIWGYVDENGREYAILGSTEYTHFFDVTDPTAPAEISRILGRAASVWRDFKTYGTYAYGVSDNSSASLQIFDLSDLPNSVTKVYDSQNFFRNCHNIYIEEATGRLYAVGTNTSDVVVLDLTSTPANPTLLKNIDFSAGNDYVHDLFVRNNIAYCSHIYNSELGVYNLTDLDNISKLGSLTNYPKPGLNHSNWLSEDGTILTMADEDKDAPMKVIDVTDLGDMNVLSTFKSTLEEERATNSIPHNSFIIGNNFVVVSYYHDGVQIYDISNPAKPFKAGYFDTDTTNTTYAGSPGCWGVYPFLPSGNIIASDINNGLIVIKPNFSMTNNCYTTLMYKETLEDEEAMALEAKISIELQAGFEAKAGSDFSAMIVDCSTDQLVGEGEKTAINNVAFEKNSLPDLVIEDLSNAVLTAFPNPFKDELNFVLGNDRIENVSSIYLVDQLGKRIQPSMVNCGDNCWQLKMENLNNGIYTLLVRDKNGVLFSEKVIKM